MSKKKEDPQKFKDSLKNKKLIIPKRKTFMYPRPWFKRSPMLPTKMVKAKTYLKRFRSLFKLAMLALFLLEFYYCSSKILHPLIIEVTSLHEEDILEIPNVTLCRKCPPNSTTV